MGLDLSALPDGATWVFTGDSITHGVVHTHGERSWVEHVHERLRWELGRLRDVVVNTGVSGWTAPQVLGEVEHLVTRFDPDVLSISLGTNDALAGERGLDPFRRSLVDLVAVAEDLGAEAVLHTPVLTTSDAPEVRRTWLPVYADVVRQVAEERATQLVDHESVWHRRLAGEAPTPWMDDHTHPNAVGHRVMARTTLEALGLGDLDGP